jgi:hypothetical protein
MICGGGGFTIRGAITGGFAFVEQVFDLQGASLNLMREYHPDCIPENMTKSVLTCTEPISKSHDPQTRVGTSVPEPAMSIHYGKFLCLDSSRLGNATVTISEKCVLGPATRALGIVRES